MVANRLMRDAVIIDDRGEVFRGRGARQKGAGIGNMLKDRPVREKRGVGDKYDPGSGPAVAGEIGDCECAAVVQNEVEHDDVDVFRDQHVNRFGFILGIPYVGPLPFKMRRPKQRQLRITLYNQQLHTSSWTGQPHATR